MPDIRAREVVRYSTQLLELNFAGAFQGLLAPQFADVHDDARLAVEGDLLFLDEVTWRAPATFSRC